ncbi:MAG: pyruvate kinase [Saprospiraceae bacterium]|nr:pyruvate kinase [Saprospiraceae bacterium]MCB9324079.1 pyruvate kinase [Lewinellaceae bacterium]
MNGNTKNYDQNTKIVATIGPASSSYDNLLELAREGVDVFRLNFSHGTHKDHKEVIDRIVKINKEFLYHVGILADLQGPKLRVGEMEGPGLEIKPGDILTFVSEKCIGTKEKIYMSYKQFAKDVTVGEKVLVDDGKLEFEVVKTNKKNKVQLKVLFGGVLKSNKGVNLPNTKISLPSLTAKDKRDLDFILTQPVNWIALSFVRSSRDLKNLKKKIEAQNHAAKIIAKIEKPEAIAKIDRIIDASDGIMIARGDLGIEVPIERLPGLQKMIIQKCIRRARPVIVATQMMDSMITNPSPTRAEVTDVANAVLDGADAVMLSGETSVGIHPVLVVKAMNRIITEAEKDFHSSEIKRPVANPESETFLSDGICFNSGRIADEVGAKAILGLTISGYTAFKVSSYRPKAKIYIFSSHEPILTTLNLVWGVRSFYYDKFTTTDETIEDVVGILKKKGRVEVGDILINTGSMPISERLRTNMLRVTLVK